MVKVVVVNGRPGVGKSEFERLCLEKCNVFNRTPGFRSGTDLWVDITSTVDFVKDIAFDCGWDGTKTPENRKFLSDLKALLTNWGDVPFNVIVQHAKSLPGTSDWLMFVDCREPAEIQRFKDVMNATTVLIRREGDEGFKYSNISDASVFDYDYDLTIHNNSDIIDLEKKAVNFIEYMRGAPHYEYDD